MNRLEKAEEILKKYNQKNLNKILKKLDETKREALVEDILETNFEEILELYKNKDNNSEVLENIEPINYIDKNKLTTEQKEELSKIGENVIKKNQYAVVTMAGGQGTRLGWKGPKGTFKLDIGKNGKYIFEILVDTLKRANKQYGTEVYWYIMTSFENHNETIQFFEEHNYFGYSKEKVKFFTQSHLPLIDMQGNLLVDNNYKIKKTSDGNGRVFQMLKKSGMLQDMKEKDIKWVYICGVDNILANMVDTILLGLTIKHNLPGASKSVKKAYPEEKVGVFCKKDGKTAVINYTDLTEEMAFSQNENNELLYGETNIASILVNIETIEKLANCTLKYHIDKKKNSYINENLEEVIPQEANTFKFELFITDLYEKIDDMLILRVNREDEFAPIKNRSGVDSPESAIKLYKNYKEKE